MHLYESKQKPKGYQMYKIHENMYFFNMGH